MHVSIGTDIIEVKRIKKTIEANATFIEKIYTEKEKNYCESKKIQKFQSYAARFAAKEAIYKALSDKIKKFEWTDFEVLNTENGKPYVNLKININNLKELNISMSHCKEYATAYVVVVFE